MIDAIIGFVIGGIFGFFVCAIIAVASDEKERLMKETKLKPCPICKKQPSILCIDRMAESTCIIKCKPFLRKPHQIVIVIGANRPQAIRKAGNEWNRRADNESNDRR